MPLPQTASAAREALGQAARTAAAHPLRSGLGGLAMAVGVATVAVARAAEMEALVASVPKQTS